MKPKIINIISKIIKILTIIIIIVLLFYIKGCDIFYPFVFSDYIELNGNIYEEEYGWKSNCPTKPKTKIVNLLDSNYKKVFGKYTAKTYECDKDDALIYYKTMYFSKKDYQFYDIKADDAIIGEIKLHNNENKTYFIKDKEKIEIFMKEYKNRGYLLSESDEEKDNLDFDVTICPTSYFACLTASTITIDTEGRFGFRSDVLDEEDKNMRLVSEELNDYLKSILIDN